MVYNNPIEHQAQTDRIDETSANAGVTNRLLESTRSKDFNSIVRSMKSGPGEMPYGDLELVNGEQALAQPGNAVTRTAGGAFGSPDGGIDGHNGRPYTEGGGPIGIMPGDQIGRAATPETDGGRGPIGIMPGDQIGRAATPETDGEGRPIGIMPGEQPGHGITRREAAGQGATGETPQTGHGGGLGGHHGGGGGNSDANKSALESLSSMLQVAGHLNGDGNSALSAILRDVDASPTAASLATDQALAMSALTSMQQGGHEQQSPRAGGETGGGPDIETVANGHWDDPNVITVPVQGGGIFQVNTQSGDWHETTGR